MQRSRTSSGVSKWALSKTGRLRSGETPPLTIVIIGLMDKIQSQNLYMCCIQLFCNKSKIMNKKSAFIVVAQ